MHKKRAINDIGWVALFLKYNYNSSCLKYSEISAFQITLVKHKDLYRYYKFTENPCSVIVQSHYHKFKAYFVISQCYGDDYPLGK